MIRVNLAQVEGLATALRELRGSDLKLAAGRNQRIIVSNCDRLVEIRVDGTTFDPEPRS